MAALPLYIAATTILTLAWRRWVQPISLRSAIILALLPLCFTGRAMLTGRVYGPVDLPLMIEPIKDYAAEYGIESVHNGFLSDLYTQIIPWAAAVRHSLASGEWPLWNPYTLCGDILAGAAQPAVYDPIQIIGLIIPLPAAITFGATMTFFLAGFFAFAFARAIGCDEIASLVCAAGWMFCGGLAFFVGWPLGRAWSYLPFVLFGVRLVAREANVRAAMILGIAFTALIVAGHPESILHVIAIGAAYGVFEVLQNRGQAWRAIAGAVVAGISALLLCAVYLLPFLASVEETYEHHLRAYLYATTPFPTIETVIERRLSNTFVAFWGGQPWRDSYSRDFDPQTGRVGSVAVALALVSLVIARRRWETWFFAALLVVTLCVGAEAPPFAHLLHTFPLFDITLNERMIFAASFAFCVLAALAVSDLTHQRSAAAGIAIVAIALAILSMVLWPVQEARGIARWLMGLLTAAELIPLAILFVLVMANVPRRVVALSVLALLLVQRTVEDGTMYPAIASRAFYPTVPLIEYVRKHIGDEPARVVGWQYAMLPNIPAVYALEDPRGYEAMTFGRLRATYPLWSKPEAVSFNRVEDLSSPFLTMINTRYAITSLDAQPPDGWQIAAQDRKCRVLENTHVLPRAFVPNWIRYEQHDIPILGAMLRETDFANKGWIEAPEYSPHDIASGPGTTRTRRRGRGFDISATMAGDGWVIISETAWNGWRAYLDGKRVKVHYANNAFIGVFAPKGAHEIRLEYLPESFTRGRNISLGTLAVLIGGAIIWRRRGARASRPH